MSTKKSLTTQSRKRTSTSPATAAKPKRARTTVPGYERLLTAEEQADAWSQALDDAPVVWGGRNLGAEGAIMLYRSRCYVRPLGRGVVLSDLEHEPHLDDVLYDGDYEIEIRVVRRLPKPTR